MCPSPWKEPLSSSGGAFRYARMAGKSWKVWRDAKKLGAPAAHFFHEGNELAAGFGERVGDFWRRVECGFAGDGAVFFEFTELGGQDFFGDAGEHIAQGGEAFWSEGKIPEREDFPLPGEDIEGGFDGTAVVLLHGGLRAYKIVRTSGGLLAVIA